MNGVQIKILNFLAELSLTPSETMPMAVNRKGRQMALFYGTYSKCFTDKTTQGWKGLDQWSTQFKNVFFAFLHIIFFICCKKKTNKRTATKIIVIQKQNNKISQRKAVHVVYILFP